jgi:UPF0716 family protein affecting phage T7 exclusion
MSWLTVILMLAAVAAGLWLVTGGLWWLLRLIGRTTGLGEKVDHALDVEGGLETADYLKFSQAHPHR